MPSRISAAYASGPKHVWTARLDHGEHLVWTTVGYVSRTFRLTRIGIGANRARTPTAASTQAATRAAFWVTRTAVEPHAQFRATLSTALRPRVLATTGLDCANAFKTLFTDTFQTRRRGKNVLFALPDLAHQLVVSRARWSAHLRIHVDAFGDDALSAQPFSWAHLAPHQIRAHALLGRFLQELDALVRQIWIPLAVSLMSLARITAGCTHQQRQTFRVHSAAA